LPNSQNLFCHVYKNDFDVKNIKDVIDKLSQRTVSAHFVN